MFKEILNKIKLCLSTKKCEIKSEIYKTADIQYELISYSKKEIIIKVTEVKCRTNYDSFRYANLSRFLIKDKLYKLKFIKETDSKLKGNYFIIDTEDFKLLFIFDERTKELTFINYYHSNTYYFYLFSEIKTDIETFKVYETFLSNNFLLIQIDPISRFKQFLPKKRYPVYLASSSQEEDIWKISKKHFNNKYEFWFRMNKNDFSWKLQFVNLKG